jgi:hypothetical protein
MKPAVMNWPQRRGIQAPVQEGCAEQKGDGHGDGASGRKPLLQPVSDDAPGNHPQKGCNHDGRQPQGRL